MSERIRTHWEDCWRDQGHHDCAVALVERLRAEVECLTAENEKLFGTVDDVATWRKTCHLQDEHMGRADRQFRDEEEWDRIEAVANETLAALKEVPHAE